MHSSFLQYLGYSPQWTEGNISHSLGKTAQVMIDTFSLKLKHVHSRTSSSHDRVSPKHIANLMPKEWFKKQKELQWTYSNVFEIFAQCRQLVAGIITICTLLFVKAPYHPLNLSPLWEVRINTPRNR
jgi:hypothetical protein